MKDLFIIKIGGNIIDDETALKSFLADFSSIGGNKILVHGGGKVATELSARLGIETKMVDGRRITDSDTIRVVTMTYAGWLNKSITARLQSLGCNAVGLSGVDGNLIPAVKRPVKDIDYGWVGDVEQEKINAKFLSQLLEGGHTPVIAPVAADGNGNLLNINADTIAQALAQVLGKFFITTLIYCFEKKGLLLDVTDASSVINEIKFNDAEDMKRRGVITNGMVPKVDNAFRALQSGVHSVVMGHAGFIKKMVSQEKGYGTYFKA